ncbi:MAG TPA: class I SAM-dependent methyltransferase [Solirubrobacterales bacterium]|nr:class I SAM-dependent methyltransferase [Solirubrobacterales bacterium]
MTGPDRHDDGIVRALGPHLGVALYDPIVAVVMRERLFRGRLIAQVLAGAPQGESLEVVDLGCGTGTTAIRLAAAGARVTGVDADPEILERARRKPGAEAVEWRSGRVEDAGLPDASCDRVVLSLVLHHLPDPVKLATLREARRLLRRDGRVHVADWGPPGDPLMRLAFAGLQLVDGRANTRAMGAGELPTLLARAGFADFVRHDRLRTAFGRLELCSARAPARA